MVHGNAVVPELLETAAVPASLVDAAAEGVVIRVCSSTFTADVNQLAQQLYGSNSTFAAEFARRFAQGSVNGFIRRGSIAFPHPRSPIIRSGRVPRILLCYLQHPLPLLAADNNPVSVLIAIIAASVKQHVGLSAMLSNRLLSVRFRELLESHSPLAEVVASLECHTAPRTPVAGNPQAVALATDGAPAHV
jgi:mannitol/fructose-specific phosphotransferase system IIA component (Ntr-type)